MLCIRFRGCWVLRRKNAKVSHDTKKDTLAENFTGAGETLAHERVQDLR